MDAIDMRTAEGENESGCVALGLLEEGGRKALL